MRHTNQKMVQLALPIYGSNVQTKVDLNCCKRTCKSLHIMWSALCCTPLGKAIYSNPQKSEALRCASQH